jgi:hypothetical protein
VQRDEDYVYADESEIEKLILKYAIGNTEGEVTIDVNVCMCMHMKTYMYMYADECEIENLILKYAIGDKTTEKEVNMYVIICIFMFLDMNVYTLYVNIQIFL